MKRSTGGDVSDLDVHPSAIVKTLGFNGGTTYDLVFARIFALFFTHGIGVPTVHQLLERFIKIPTCKTHPVISKHKLSLTMFTGI